MAALACGPADDDSAARTLPAGAGGAALQVEHAREGGVPEVASDRGPEGFARARGTRVWRFPRDHGAHPDFATEWWYTTGIVRTEAGRRFGFELTFFRRGLSPPASSGDLGPRRQPDDSVAVSPWRARDLLLAHAAVTDERGGRFVTEERLERVAHGWAGADTAGLDVWIGDWRLSAAEDGGFRLRVPPASTGGRLGLDLRLRADRPPVLHGEGGLSPKDARADPHASWYVSLPRLETRGALAVGGERFEVSGFTWMDHEFFSGGLAPGQVGWDWFSARLADGRDLVLFRLRRAGGGTDFAAGTVTSADGREARPLDARGAIFEPGDPWEGSDGATYPTAWTVRLPAEGLRLRARAAVSAQEVAPEDGAGFAYWEGLVDYAGVWGGEAVRGEGYLEMTGYGRPVELR